MVEVHISNPNAREPWRHTSVVAPVATGSIMGFGKHGYDLAVQAVAAKLGIETDGPQHAAADRLRRAGRRDSRRRSTSAGCRRLLVTNMTNMRWLTGFTGSSAVGGVAARPAGARDRRSLRAIAPHAELAAAGVDGRASVGFTQAEQHDAVVVAFAVPAAVGAEAAIAHARTAGRRSPPSCRWSPPTASIEDARRVKDAGEIARIAAACRCADAALAEVAPMLGDGVTEADVRIELEYRMRRHGADGPSYDTIVASGPEHAARPHHEVGERRIVEGDTVVIDVGALVDGYHSDMTRSFVIGEPIARAAAAVRPAARRCSWPGWPPCVPACRRETSTPRAAS